MTELPEQSALGWRVLQSVRLERSLGALEHITIDALSNKLMNKISNKLSIFN